MSIGLYTYIDKIGAGVKFALFYCICTHANTCIHVCIFESVYIYIIYIYKIWCYIYIYIYSRVLLTCSETPCPDAFVRSARN